MMYLDLDELPRLLRSGRWLYGAWFSPGSFRREDHFGDPRRALKQTVCDFVADQTGARPAGPVRLLTQLRHFGYYFSPLNLYYCFDPGGERVESVVAEVSNTPWRERHHYLLWDGNRRGEPDRLEFRHPKDFHVSPFLGMDYEYRWRLSEPGEQLKVYLANHKDDRRVFDASLVLSRRPLNRLQVARTWVRYPLMTVQVMAAIYYQALRLWMKKCPYFPHPKSAPPHASLRTPMANGAG